MTKAQKIWIAVGIGASILIAVILWRAGVACSTPRFRVPMKIGEAAGCYEFWFNRYQSALGGALALIAAFVAGRYAIIAAKIAVAPANEQIAIAQQQTAITAFPILKDILGTHIEEKQASDTISHTLNEIERIYERFCDDAQANAVHHFELDRLIGNLSHLTSTLTNLVEKYSLGEHNDAVRRDVATKGRALAQLYEPAAEILRLPPHEDNRDNRLRVELASIRRRHPGISNALRSALNDLEVLTAATGQEIARSLLRSRSAIVPNSQ